MKNKTLDPGLSHSMPLVSVRDMVVFPYMITPLYVGRDLSIKAVEAGLSRDRHILLATQKHSEDEVPDKDSIYKTGVVANIMRQRRLPDGRIKILIQGVAKARVESWLKLKPYFEVKVNILPEAKPMAKSAMPKSSMKMAKDMVEKIVSMGRAVSPDILLVLEDVSDPGHLADLIASTLNFRLQEAQRVLEIQDPVERLEKVNTLLANELEVTQVQSRIKNTAKEEIVKSQREYFLREQMRAIKNELGDADPKNEEFEELLEKIKQSGMPVAALQEAQKQFKRLERMHPDTSEASIIRTYLETLSDLPWSKHVEKSINLDEAKKILDKEHFGLQKVKERILEFLAVRVLKGTAAPGPIICFTGPPGVGKTSFGKSIAMATGRKFHRLSLGGIKDEAEVRGHRRTYVGAMPGKIIAALKSVQSNNPVVVLDEIDKMGSDFRGDPSAAMLEVLDPEQNKRFKDNYINLDFDISNVLFVATANVAENIPAVLRDRMEMIPISGYTDDEKLQIAKRHLVERQLEATGLEKNKFHFTDEGLLCLVQQYTREAGVRNLNRQINNVCRKLARGQVAKEPRRGSATACDSGRIDKAFVKELLGAEEFVHEKRHKTPKVGVSIGLAWTPVGGEILHIEALSFKGEGALKLTGQLGDVMKESAQAALSYIKSNHAALGIRSGAFEAKDVHVHVPAGAIRKDGPSAGVAIVSALVSLMRGVPIKNTVAMTGEVTLGGRVLAVGGIKGKILAALRQGITHVVLPADNRKDLESICPKILKQIKFSFVSDVSEVLDQVLLAEELKRRGGTVHQDIVAA